MRLAVPPTNPSSEVKSMHAKYWGNSIESIPLVANFPSLTFKLMHFLVIIGQGRVGHRMKNFAIHYFTKAIWKCNGQPEMIFLDAFELWRVCQYFI